MQRMVHEAKYDKIFKRVRRGASFVDGCFSNFCLQKSWKERVDILLIIEKSPKILKVGWEHAQCWELQGSISPKKIIKNTIQYLPYLSLTFGIK